MVVYKRILLELNKKIPEELIKLNLDNKFYFTELGNDIVCKEIGIINKKTNKLELVINIPSSYPFKPPNVLVNCNSNNKFSSKSIWERYDKWCASLIKKPFLIPIKRNNYNIKDIDLFNAWVFSIIKRPQLIDYW